ncbi:hypothetical protein [Sorangium sp. So ce1000]|uniref:hypothetical protein n=1 Tax=Sorangium sp. So ce1000 TaxID=3133325 RepID=UPI003F61F409
MLGQSTNGMSEAPDDFAELGAIKARLLALAWFPRAAHGAVGSSAPARRVNEREADPRKDRR